MHYPSIIYKIKNNRTILNGGLFSVFSFVNQGISFILLIILAKFILPDDYGRLSLFNTVLMFVGYFIAFSSGGYMSVSYFKSEKLEFKKVFTSIVCLAIGTSLFFFVLASLVNLFNGIDLGFPSYLLWYAAIISFFTCIVNLLLDYLRIRNKVIFFGLTSCGNAAMNFVFSILLVVSSHHGWLGRVEAQLSCYVLIGLFALFYFKSKDLFVLDLSINRFKTLILWGAPIIPHLGAMWIRQGCDRYIVNYFHSVNEVGLFSFALNLTSIIMMIGAAFNQANSVSIYNVLSDKTIEDKYSVLKKQSKIFFYMLLFLSIVVSALIYILIPYVLPQYDGALHYFAILTIYGFLQCVYFIFCNYLFYFDATKNLMYITFSTSIIHLVLSLILTRFSLMFTCCIYVVVHLLVLYLVITKSMSLLRKNNIIKFEV